MTISLCLSALESANVEIKCCRSQVTINTSVFLLQKQAAYEKYENRVQELMHDEKQQERAEEEKQARAEEYELHKVRISHFFWGILWGFSGFFGHFFHLYRNIQEKTTLVRHT